MNLKAILKFDSFQRFLFLRVLNRRRKKKEQVWHLLKKTFRFRCHAVLKLQKLLEEVGKKAEKKKYKIAWSRDFDESGFYLIEDKCWCFWCGIWGEAFRKEGLLLSFGIPDEGDEKIPGIRKAFCSAYKGVPKQFEGHTLGWIPQEMLEGDDALEKVWARLEPILDAVHKAAHRNA